MDENAQDRFYGGVNDNTTVVGSDTFSQGVRSASGLLRRIFCTQVARKQDFVANFLWGFWVEIRVVHDPLEIFFHDGIC